MTKARQRRFVSVIAWVVLLGAILPNVAYIGHWTVRGLETAHASGDGDDGHANHCHGSSSCADQAGYGLNWWADGHDSPSLDGGPERAQAPEATPSASDPVTLPLDRPPQYA